MKYVFENEEVLAILREAFERKLERQIPEDATLSFNVYEGLTTTVDLTTTVEAVLQE